MTKLQIEVLKAEDNYRNSYLADEDKICDQIMVSTTVETKKFSALGDTQDEAIEDLRGRIADHYNAIKYVAQLEIDKAIGLHFHD